MAAATLSIVHFGGPDFYQYIGWCIAAETGAILATLGAFLIMALSCDKRPVSTLDFPPRGAAAGLVGGTLIGAAIFAVPLAILSARGFIRYAPDFSHFSAAALRLALLLVFVNVIDQELIVAPTSSMKSGGNIPARQW